MMRKNKKTTKQKLNNVILSIIFLIGLTVMIYPLVSRIYYRVESSQQIATFDDEKKKMNQEEIDKRIQLAQAFNDTLSNVVSGDPWSDEMKKKGRAEYARMLEIHEQIGHVEIPTIDVDLPIYAGSSEEVLQQGAGHLEGTSLPIGGNSTHSVITAHTGLPTAKMFTDLKKLKIGDKFYVHNIKETMAYQVDQIKVVEPSNFSDLLIVPGHDYVTLLTCTPYMINTHRLLVRAHRIDYVPEVEEEFIASNQTSHLYRYLFYLAVFLIGVLLSIIYRLRKKKRQSEKILKELIATKEVDVNEN